VEKLVENYTFELGGSCGIFAAQAAKLGLRVAVLGKVGADEFGAYYRRKLTDTGVDTRYLYTDPAIKTGVTVHLSPPGDRAMLTYLGSLGALTPGDVTDDFLRSARHLHYGSLFLHTGLLAEWVNILRRVKGFGLTLSLDTNWDPSERWDAGLAEALSLIDVFLPNDQEARLIARSETVEAAASDLRARVPVLALKLGADGARAYRGNEVEECHPQPAEPGGDSTGAGDSFDAGFIAGWLNGLSLADCLKVGCACGRSVAGQIGGIAEQLWRRDVPQLASLERT
jgi:sugar/nucleoside kinase (ribokinase family)